MTRRNNRWIRALVLGALVLPLPATGQNDTDHASQAFAEALAFATPETTYVAFTDWEGLKAAQGLEIVDSRLPLELRMVGMVRLTESDAVFSGFGLQQIHSHADTWGWDASDFVWDAQIIASNAPVNVVRFRDDLDLEPFEALLDEREFTTVSVGDVTIRSHELDLSSHWVGTTELAINNTAILPDGHTLVMSSSVEALEAALAAAATATPSAVSESAMGRVAAALGDALSAAIEAGPGACTRFSETSRTPETDPDAALIADVGPLSAWHALGLGSYPASGAAPGGRIVLLMEDADTATREVAGRARLAREGHSRVSAAPLAEVVFGVHAASTNGAVVRIDLSPVGGRSRLLLRSLYSLDLLPARCGPA